ncbi:Adenylate cyclase type 10, partial [Spheniscus mendiculus]
VAGPGEERGPRAQAVVLQDDAHLPQHIGRFLLSLPESVGGGESGLSRAFTFPSPSPGDAVLVLWRTPPQELAKTISLVLQCSWQIQKKCGSRGTHVGQKVHLKIGISAGSMSLLTVGDRRRQYFLICGQVLGEVCEAEQLANAGEVILSATCWELCEQHRLRTKRLAGKRAVKVGGNMSKRRRLFLPRFQCQPLLSNTSSSHPPSDHLHFLSSGATRPAFLLPSGRDVDEVLRKYVPEAALRKIYDSMPLGLLSELRPVTSLFIQLRLAEDNRTANLYRIVHSASRMMLEILCPHKGKINKVLLFDKGCTFLCVFGLTGEKLPYESLHALQSAMQIFNSCSTMLREIG